MDILHRDSKIIEALGGSANLARLLGYGKYGTQRVNNWKIRGIPAFAILNNPNVFTKKVLKMAA